MTFDEMIAHHAKRAIIVLTKQVNENFNYENGILLHAFPNNLLTTIPINWTDRQQSNCPRIAFKRFSDPHIQFEPFTDGHIGYTDREYTIWFDNGIIETFSSPIVHMIELPNEPIVNSVKVESILMHSNNFMNAYMDTYEECFDIGIPHSILISLIGVKNVFYNARERRYITTLPCPTDIYSFPVVTNNGQSREDYWNDILESIHSTLMQLAQ